MDAAALVTPYNHISFKRRKNTWYTIASGNWTNPAIWMSNSHRRYDFPQTGDDVSIGLGHTVTCNTSASLNNLYVAGSLLFDTTARTITLTGNIQATGSVNMSGSSHSLVLSGVSNYVNAFVSGTASTVTYGRVGDQPIMPLTYFNLTTINTGVKYLVNDLNVSGVLSLSTSSTFNPITYNVSVTGQTQLVGGGTFVSTSSSNNYLFIGNFFNFTGTVSFSGTPNLEFRGGVNANTSISFSNSAVNFTTNNQSLTGSGTLSITAQVTITGNITVTNSNTGGVSVGSVIGTTASSTLSNSGRLILTSNGLLPMSSLGVFNYNSSVSSFLSFAYNGDATLPYTTYSGLIVAGTGTKTLLGSTTTTSITLNGALECSSFNLTVGGAATINAAGLLKKSSSGNLLFTGLLTLSSGGAISFSGNPDVELQGGISMSNSVIANGDAGSGTISFTTNNQSIAFTLSTTAIINNNLLISGAITVTSTGTGLTVTGTINGNNAASTFDNRGTVNYQATQQPMLTGILQTNLAANTFIYNAAGNQNITGGTYRTMQIGGTATPNNKTLQGNIVVATAYSATGNALLVLNGFTKT